MAGVAGLNKDQQAGLMHSLAGQSAPPNPSTPMPSDRKEPGEESLLDFRRVQRSLQVAKDHLEDGDPKQVLVGAVYTCFVRLLSSVELSDAVDVLLERVFPLSSSTLKQRLSAMYAPISPPTGLGGGAPGSVPDQGPAMGATGQPPGGAPQSPPAGEAGLNPA